MKEKEKTCQTIIEDGRLMAMIRNRPARKLSVHAKHGNSVPAWKEAGSTELPLPALPARTLLLQTDIHLHIILLHPAEKRFPTTPAISRSAARKCCLQEAAFFWYCFWSSSFPHAPALPERQPRQQRSRKLRQKPKQKRPRQKLPQLKPLKNLFLLPSA